MSAINFLISGLSLGIRNSAIITYISIKIRQYPNFSSVFFKNSDFNEKLLDLSETNNEITSNPLAIASIILSENCEYPMMISAIQSVNSMIFQTVTSDVSI